MSLRLVCGRDDVVGVAASVRAAPVARVMLCFWVCRFSCNHHLDICQVVVIDVALAYRSEPCARWFIRLNLVAAPNGEQCMLLRWWPACVPFVVFLVHGVFFVSRLMSVSSFLSSHRLTCTRACLP